MSSSETRQHARYGNLAQLYPFGAQVHVVLTARTDTTNVTARGKVVYTDALGIALQYQGETAFYPWHNVIRVAGANR